MGWMLDWCLDWNRDWFGPSSSPTIPGTGPAGVGAFSLDLLNGYTVKFRWIADVIKKFSGKEQRRLRIRRPQERYSGSALMFGTAPAEQRAQLARYAAQGQQFLLGLPHEEMSFRLAASGTTIYVHDTTASDWMNPGQRVIVRRELESVEAVIQSVTADSITLDIDPGTLGLLGGTIMPAQAILLEPEQSFPRYPTAAEEWNIEARAATFGFARELATLAIGPYTSAAGLNSATVTERYPGACASFQLLGNRSFGESMGEYTADVVAQYTDGVGFAEVASTVQDLYALLLTSARVVPTGTWGTGPLGASDEMDELLTGGTTVGPWGTGATLTTYAGDGTTRAVWDRKLDNDSQITDSIHAMTEILDYGALPYSIGSADYADWGRSVQYEAPLGDEWQWWKLFMATVKGQQKAFWLPTWRDDLPCVSSSTNTITVEADVAAWWPAQRQYVQIEHAAGIGYYKVTAGTDNGNGTWTLTIGATLTGVEVVSWLELARWTSGEFAVSFTDGHLFSFDSVATVVQQ